MFTRHSSLWQATTTWRPLSPSSARKVCHCAQAVSASSASWSSCLHSLLVNEMPFFVNCPHLRSPLLDKGPSWLVVRWIPQLLTNMHKGLDIIESSLHTVTAVTQIIVRSVGSVGRSGHDRNWCSLWSRSWKYRCWVRQWETTVSYMDTEGWHLWASCQIRIFAGCACAGNAGNVFPTADFKGNR